MAGKRDLPGGKAKRFPHSRYVSGVNLLDWDAHNPYNLEPFMSIINQ
jgi:hypothetical protein